MVSVEPMRVGNNHQIELRGRRVNYRLVLSRSARKLRIRVSIDGIEVVQPVNRTSNDVMAFLDQNEEWVLNQLERVDRLRKLRVTDQRRGEILFRGERTPIRIQEMANRSRGNHVRFVGGEIVVQCPAGSRTPVSRSLENWLRRQARTEIEKHLETVTFRLRQRHHRIYVMGQRTKWGNCSSERNLSFNWRLILAPDFVLRYLVTHEAVHLEIPDHSAKFWLTVQSHCPETERAKQWLRANGERLAVELHNICDEIGPMGRDSKRPSRHRTGRGGS